MARGARKLDRPAFGGPRGLNRKGGSREPLTDNGGAVRASAGGPFADQAEILCQGRRNDDPLAALRHAARVRALGLGSSSRPFSDKFCRNETGGDNSIRSEEAPAGTAFVAEQNILENRAFIV